MAGMKALGSFAHGDGGGAGHAALAGASESGVGEAFDRFAKVGIRHDDDEVFSSTGCLHALAVGGSGFVNVFGDGRASYERDGGDAGMLEKGVDAVFAAMDDGEDSGREACFF